MPALGGEAVGGELVDTELTTVFSSEDGIRWTEVAADATIYSILVFVLMTLMNFVVAITAGIAVLRTKIAPTWAGLGGSDCSAPARLSRLAVRSPRVAAYVVLISSGDDAGYRPDVGRSAAAGVAGLEDADRGVVGRIECEVVRSALRNGRAQDRWLESPYGPCGRSHGSGDAGP